MKPNYSMRVYIPLFILFLLLLILSLSSCKPYQLTIPNRFSEQSTRMEVKGWNSYKQLRFGSYQTSKVKRGLLTKNSRSSKRAPVTSADRVSRIFDVEASSVTERSKDHFQYTISDGNQVAEVLATEGSIHDMLKVKTGVRWLGDFSQTKNYQYAFSAVIIPVTNKDTSVWQLAVYNGEHPPVDSKGRKAVFRYPLELGLATNAIDTVTINQIRVTHSTSPKGREATMPFEIPGGYELRMDGGVVGIINQWNHEIWFYNDLDEPTKLVLSAIASSLLLRKIKSIK